MKITCTSHIYRGFLVTNLITETYNTFMALRRVEVIMLHSIIQEIGGYF